jgi:hypothetical protein
LPVIDWHLLGVEGARSVFSGADAQIGSADYLGITWAHCRVCGANSLDQSSAQRTDRDDQLLQAAGDDSERVRTQAQAGAEVLLV